MHRNLSATVDGPQFSVLPLDNKRIEVFGDSIQSSEKFGLAYVIQKSHELNSLGGATAHSSTCAMVFFKNTARKHGGSKYKKIFIEVSDIIMPYTNIGHGRNQQTLCPWLVDLIKTKRMSHGVSFVCLRPP